jgi:hypothetical protein
MSISACRPIDQLDAWVHGAKAGAHLCPHCKEPGDPPDDETWRAITALARGSPTHHGTGRLPRMPDDRYAGGWPHEIMLMTAIRKLVTPRRTTRDSRAGVKDGMKRFAFPARWRAAGLTTAEEVVKVAPP